MDWKTFSAAFAAIFIAELADKTQFIGLSLAARTGRPVSVWLGSVLSYMLITVVTVTIGALLGRHLRPEVVRYAAGTLFVCAGVLMFMGKL